MALVVGQLRFSVNERPPSGHVTWLTNRRAGPGGGWTEPGRHPADREAVPHPLLLLLYKLHNVKTISVKIDKTAGPGRLTEETHGDIVCLM